MLKIDYPFYQFKIKEENGRDIIFDEIRKKWVLITPEEWVRQNMIQYFLQTMLYPAKLMAIEKEIKLGELVKRCDIVIYQHSIPWMIIECKEPSVPLSEKTMEQILRYHQAMPAAYLCLSNGNHVYLFEKRNNQFFEVFHFPKWE
jgi:hypothetical protein